MVDHHIEHGRDKVAEGNLFLLNQTKHFLRIEGGYQYMFSTNPGDGKGGPCIG